MKEEEKEEDPLDLSSSGDDNESVDPVENSQLIREATAAAIDDAIKMKRSDSFLSISDEDEDDEANNSLDDEKYPPAPGIFERGISRHSERYTEEASFEAALLSPNRHHVAPSGRFGKRRMSSSSRNVIDLRRNSQTTTTSSNNPDEGGGELDYGEDFGGKSERDVFRGMSSSNFEGHNLPLDTIYSVSVPSEEDPLDETSEI
jgi:hypothetical protein